MIQTLHTITLENYKVLPRLLYDLYILLNSFVKY